MVGHDVSQEHAPPAGRQNSGAMLLSMLKQGQKPRQQQPPNVAGPPGCAAHALPQDSIEPRFANVDVAGPAPGGSSSQQTPGKQPLAQPWQLWSSPTPSQQHFDNPPGLFNVQNGFEQHQKPGEAATNLQRLFSASRHNPLGAPAAQQAMTAAAGPGSSLLDPAQQWQQQMDSQPLFAAAADSLTGLPQPPQHIPQQPAAPGFDRSVPAHLSAAVAATGHIAASNLGLSSMRGPPPGFGGIGPAQMQQPMQPMVQQTYQSTQQQQQHSGANTLFSNQLSNTTQQPQGGQLPLFGAQGLMQPFNNSQQAYPPALFPQPILPPLFSQQQQQSIGPGSGQHSQQPLLPQQLQQQQQLGPQGPFMQQLQQPGQMQQQLQQQQHGVTADHGQPGGNLQALLARMHLQHQQQPLAQQSQTANLPQQQQLPPPMQQQRQQQPQPQQQQQHETSLLKQEQFQMLLSKLHPGSQATADSASSIAGLAGVAAAGAATAAVAAAAAAQGVNGYPAAAAAAAAAAAGAEPQQNSPAPSAINIPHPNHAAATGPAAAAAAGTVALMPSSLGSVAAAGFSGLASARSSIAGSPGGFSMLDQLSSSAPTSQGFMRSGHQASAAAPKRPTPHAPPAIRQDVRMLDAQLTALAEQLAPTDAQRQRQQMAWKAVSGLLQCLWPQGKVHLFGSAANGMDIGNNNDLDVCLELEGVEETRDARGDVISELGEQLDAAGMKNVFAIPRARMPVVKFEHPQTGFKVDITVNNRLAVVNTKLLRDYAALDPRLRQLVLLVKHWAKRRRCNEAYVGTLSSYAYVLLCIAHLQARSPPVLPVLQELQPFTHQRTIGTWCCDYNDDIPALASFGSANTESVAQLLLSFFYYWAHQHDYRRTVVTIRSSRVLTKAMKSWTTRVGMERHLFCIEDPFELSHDLGRTVHAEGCDKLRHEFRRAWDICHHSSSPQQLITELFAQAPAPPPPVVPAIPLGPSTVAEAAVVSEVMPAQ